MKRFIQILIIFILLIIPTSCSHKNITKENFSEYFIINQRVYDKYQEKNYINDFTVQYTTTCTLSIEITPRDNIKVNKNMIVYLSVYPAKWFITTPLDYFKTDDNSEKSQYMDDNNFIHYIVHSKFNKDGTIKLDIPCKSVQTLQTNETYFSDTEWLPSAEIYDVVYN